MSLTNNLTSTLVTCGEVIKYSKENEQVVINTAEGTVEPDAGVV